MAVHQTSEATLKRAQVVKAEDSPDVGLVLLSGLLSGAEQFFVVVATWLFQLSLAV